jgi:RNA polymerase sigma-70 factor (ECF subfamily)
MDRALVEQAMHGNHDAFGALAGACVDRLYGAALLMLGDHDHAEDAVQATLVRAWRDLARLRDPDRFQPWLHRILLNTCRDALRAARRTASPIALDLAPSTDHATQVGDLDELSGALRRLTADQRAVVVLRFYADLSVPEIAATLGVPLGTAKSRLSRALEALRAAIAAESRRAPQPEERP